jgi:glucoamylase
VQYFASLNIAEQVYDALHTWDILGKLEVTKVSLDFFRQFDKLVRIGTYRKGGVTYNKLTSGLKKWTEKTILSLAERTPDDYVLPLVMNKDTGLPQSPPGGALRSQVAVLGLNNAYKGVLPPSWVTGDENPWKRPSKSSIVKGGDCHGSADDYDEVYDENQFSFEF